MRQVIGQRVTAAVDGAPQGVAAALWAAEEAVRRGSSLRLVHAGPLLTALHDRPAAGRPTTVGPHDDPQSVSLRMLEHVRGEVERRHRGLVVECRVARGLVVDALVRIAEDGELLVLGSRGLGGFRELLLGSVGLATAARAEVPVVVVRPVPEHLADRPGSGWGQILVGLDAYAPSAGLLEFAFAEAALRGSRLVVVHGWDLPPSWSSLGWSMPSAVASADMQAAEAAQLTRALLGWRERFSGTEVVAEARIGGAAAALVADSARADLVVVGRKSLLHRDGPGLGPVAHAVLHHARAPVAVVPHPVGE